jgi:hypothetical protein
MQKILLSVVLSFSLVVYSQTPGNALNFDGANDMVVCPTVPPLFSNLATNDFTYEAWVYPTAAIFSRIIYAQASTTNFATMSTGGTGNIYFYVIVGGTTYSVATTTNLPLNQWTHVACRWTASTLLPQVFFNGILQPGSGGGGSSTGTNGLMTLGARPGGAQYFPGSMDEVRVWSEARTQCEIQSNMHSEFITPQPNLVAYYNFNQGVAGGANAGVTTLPDINSTYNGTLNNFALTGAGSNWIGSGAAINSVGPSFLSSSFGALICSGDVYSFGGQNLSTPGVYVDTLVTAGGCDSLVTLTLDVLSTGDTTLNVSTCNQYVFNSVLLTASGTYMDTLTNINGCDSMVTLNLTIYNTTNNSISATACNQFSFNSTLLTTSGIYTDTLTAVTGCDSIVTLNLTLNNSQTNTLNQTSCDDYLFNGNLLTTSGIYADTLSTVNGCDSIVTLNLTINTVNNGVTQVGNVLTANAIDAAYQWLDCNNNFAPLVGETNMVLNASANGSYAVEVVENGCTDTSACVVVNTFGIENNGETNLMIYPNPTEGVIQIQTDANVLIEWARLVNLNGQVLQTFTLLKGELVVIDLSAYSPGVYFLQTFAEGKQTTYRIMRK